MKCAAPAQEPGDDPPSPHDSRGAAGAPLTPLSPVARGPGTHGLPAGPCHRSHAPRQSATL